MSRLRPVEGNDVDSFWPHIENYVRRALKHADGKFDVYDIYKGCKYAHMLLWIVYNDKKILPSGCFVTELHDYPRERRLNFLTLGADDLNDVLSHLPAIKDWAKANGAHAMELYGRPGWSKALKPSGFDSIHTVMRLRLL